MIISILHANLEVSVNAHTQKLTPVQIITERALFASVYTLLERLWFKFINLRLPHFDGNVIKVTQEGQNWIVSLSHEAPDLVIGPNSIIYGDISTEDMPLECEVIMSLCELYKKYYD